MISGIVALDLNDCIGVQNKLPWHLPADLKHFKEVTSGHAVIMGRKTYESIGRPLPGRKNIVLTRASDLKIAGCEVVQSLDTALALAASDSEVFIIGGSEIFKIALTRIQKLYLTRVETRVDSGDAFFPKLDLKQWREIEKQRHAPDEKNPFYYEFITLVRL